MSDAGIAVIIQADEQSGQTEPEATLFAEARDAEVRWKSESENAQPNGSRVLAAAKEVRLTYRLLMDTLIAKRERVIAALAPADLRIYLDTIGRSEEGLLLGTR